MMKRTFYIKTDSSELRKCFNQINSWDGRTRYKVEKAVQNGSERIESGAKRRVHSESGKLRDSIESKFKASNISAEVKAYAPHAHLVEFGAKKTIIVPKKKKALTVMGYGLQRFAARVVIPARAAHPFMKPAYDAQKGEILSEVKKAVNHK